MADTTTEIDDVLVVGGGDVGLLTGLSIRQFNPDIDVTVVDDFDSDPPEVGKSTYEDITGILHGALDIPKLQFISEAKPIWKGSVYFRDWCGVDPFHYAFDASEKFPDAYTPRFVEYAYHYYDEAREDPDLRTVDEAMVEEGKSAMSFASNTGAAPQGGGIESYTHAYHLDLSRFNSFLEDVCEDRGITLIDDEVEAVDTDGDHVERVASSDSLYLADLYVDATGFNRVLKSELDDDFRDFDLPLDAAFSAKIERPLSEAVPGTVIETGDHGWFWQIDTYEFRDVGYVFGSDFVGDEEAAAEFAEHCGGAIAPDELNKHEFNSGYYETPLQGNCVTIGNAVGFVEPLQSTALTANAQAALKLSHVLSTQGGLCNDGTRERYNAWVERLWESIYDFVCLHYRLASGDTEFWETVQSVPVSSRLTTLMESYDQRGFDTGLDGVGIDPITGDDSVSNLLVFPPESFYAIMFEMGAESDFYEENPFPPTDAVREEIEDRYASMERKADLLLTIEEMYEGILPQMVEDGRRVTR